MDIKLNNDLLKAMSSDDEKKEDRPKKRNSKEELIEKIIQVAKHNNMTIPHSDTKLKRMTKQQLTEYLAEQIEKVMRDEMARQVGAKPGATDSVIALGALRMVHDICAKGTEQCFNIFLPQYGYEVDGFTDSLKDPSVREATDACLVEIAQDTDVLQYVQSPWARLGIAWAGALLTSIQRKKTRYNYQRRYAPRMDASEYVLENTRREHRPRRREEDGKIDGDCGPIVETRLEV
jgi:hypothetical protein